MRVTVLLADGRGMFREVLHCLLQQHPGVEAVAVAENGHEALELARTLSPAVAVVNGRLPGIGGVEVARRIAAELASVRVVGLAESAAMAAALAGAGASAVLRADDSLASLAHAMFGEQAQPLGFPPPAGSPASPHKPEDIILEEAQRYRAIVEDQTELICRFLPDATITFVNEVYCRYFGKTREELVGRRFLLMIPEDEQPRLLSHLASLSPSRPWAAIDHRVVVPGGHTRWLQWANRATFGRDGRALEIQGTGRDITEPRQAEEALRKAHGDLEQRVQERTAELVEANASLERQIAERRRVEEALRESKERYRSIFETAPHVIGLVSRDGIITDCNQKVREVLGFEPHEVIGRPITSFLLPECREKARSAVQQVLNGAASRNNEYKVTRKDGSVVDISINSSSLKDENGESVLLISVMEDITVRKQAEEALRQSEERYRRLVELIPAAVTVCDFQGRLVQVNSEFERVTGWARHEAIGKTAELLGLSSPEFFGRIKNDILPRLLAVGAVSDVEAEVTCRNGRRLATSQNWVLMRNAAGGPAAVLAVCSDITYRKEAERKLLDHREQLRSMASELSLAEERERRRIAVSLHDGISQSLAVAKLKLGELQRAAAQPGDSRKVGTVLQFIEQAIKDTRLLTVELCPPVLYELGFEASLEWLTEQFQERHGIVCEFEDDKQPKPMDHDICVVLFQSVRELLMNVAKHAHARGAKVSVRRTHAAVLAAVEDDGTGFDVSKIGGCRGQTGCFGLFSIRERLGHLGGSVQIVSAPGQGTRIQLVAPLKGGVETGKAS